MPSTHYTSEHFDCPRLGARALIMRFHLTVRPQDAESGSTTRTECFCRHTCGIADIRGPLVFYDWSKCYHPELKRRAG